VVEPIKHLIGLAGYARDSVATVAFVAQIAGHDAEDVGAAASEDDSAIIANAFEFTGLVGDAQVFRKFARDITLLVNAEQVEVRAGEFLIQNLAAIEGLQEQHQFSG